MHMSADYVPTEQRPEGWVERGLDQADVVGTQMPGHLPLCVQVKAALQEMLNMMEMVTWNLV